MFIATRVAQCITRHVGRQTHSYTLFHIVSTLKFQGKRIIKNLQQVTC